MLILQIGISQATIQLDNPSFEGIEQCCNTPFYWIDCEVFINETPPNVHTAGLVGVKLKPYHKNSYLGIVVRDNNTWECVSNRLPQTLQAGTCNTFSVYLARFDTYLSPTRQHPAVKFEFTKPTRIRIWAGNTKTNEKQLLAISIQVRHLFWKKYEFLMLPNQDMDVLILEAMYAARTNPYN